jgi:hypothetical protein
MNHNTPILISVLTLLGIWVLYRRIPLRPAHLKAAEQGDAEAQLAVGLTYFENKGTPADINEAVRWMELSAQQGYLPAECCLAELIGKGSGYPLDSAKAQFYWRKAAEKGFAEAQFRTAQACEGKHLATEQDYQEAVKWYRLAAEQGHIRAQAELGSALMQGQGVPKDCIEAYAWCSLAAAKNSRLAIDLLAIIEKEMSPDQIKEGRQRLLQYAQAYNGTPPKIEALERVQRQFLVQEYACALCGINELCKKKKELTCAEIRRGNRLAAALRKEEKERPE